MVLEIKIGSIIKIFLLKNVANSFHQFRILKVNTSTNIIPILNCIPSIESPRNIKYFL